MISRQFPYGSTIVSMSYNEVNLTITFKKRVGIQERTYLDVPREHAYKLYYENQPKKIMSYYSTNIKNQYKVLKVKDKS